MVDNFFPQTLLLLGLAVLVVLAFQRLYIPSSLAYLLVGVLLGPHTVGPVIDPETVQGLAEFGIVFLLFTIGLNFSLPHIRSMRHLLLSLGTAQVLLTTASVGVLLGLLGLPASAAFVVGVVFAQSSTTIISKQLAEQGEDQSRHGRLAIAMSVFQDVTAVPFVVIIPVLGTAATGAAVLASSLGLAFAKAALAFALVFLLGRQVLRPLFQLVAERRSPEIFTLTVLFVSLIAAWTTNSFGLSMAFGAFLAGMVLGETEFRHQVESSIRPFRDVLLGLFFVGVGMLFDVLVILQIWHWALGGAALLLGTKIALVALIVRVAGIDALTAWRTSFLLAVGGEFGFALLAIALNAAAIAPQAGQIVLASVLFSMVIAPLFIRHNQALARFFAPRSIQTDEKATPQATAIEDLGQVHDHVVICGYGRIGQSVARLLEQEEIPYVALDLEPTRVKEARIASELVFYGDAAERGILESVGISTARLVVISHDDVASALRTLNHVRSLRSGLPVMVRTRDESHIEELRAAGASEVVPETLEASLMIAAHALLLLNVPIYRVVHRMREQWEGRYHLLGEFFQGDSMFAQAQEYSASRLRPVTLAAESPVVGSALEELDLNGVAITALVRQGERQTAPPGDFRLEAGDVVVLFGPAADLDRAERVLLG